MVYRIHRGGSYRDECSTLRCSARGMLRPPVKLAGAAFVLCWTWRRPVHMPRIARDQIIANRTPQETLAEKVKAGKVYP